MRWFRSGGIDLTLPMISHAVNSDFWIRKTGSNWTTVRAAVHDAWILVFDLHPSETGLSLAWSILGTADQVRPTFDLSGYAEVDFGGGLRFGTSRPVASVDARRRWTALATESKQQAVELRAQIETRTAMFVNRAWLQLESSPRFWLDAAARTVESGVWAPSPGEHRDTTREAPPDINWALYGPSQVSLFVQCMLGMGQWIRAWLGRHDSALLAELEELSSRHRRENQPDDNSIFRASDWGPFSELRSP